MAFFDDLSKKVKNVAAVATEKTKDGVELAKINMAIAGEQREMEKTYKAIGEWIVSEYTGEIPEGIKELVDAIAASKAKIAELEASKPKKEEEAPAEPQPSLKTCPICGAESDSKFCPQCGAPMDT